MPTGRIWTPTGEDTERIIDVERVANFTDKQKEIFAHIGYYSDIFAGGQRGGGKTHFVVSAAVICALQVPGLRVGVGRLTADELRLKLIDDVLMPLYGDCFEWYASTLTAKFGNGSVIYFKSFEDPKSVRKWKGVDLGMILLDEANEFEYSMIQQFRGSLRSFRLKNWKPTLLMTGNPGGVCDEEIRTYFVFPESNYHKWEKRELDRKHEYKYVQFGLDDNPHHTPEYAQMLDGLPEELYRAWRLGDWNAVQGRFFSEWDPKHHVVHYDHVFPDGIPEDWPRWRGIDLGYGKHPSVCLFATQNPENGVVYIYNEVSTLDTTDVFIELVKVASIDPDGREGEFAITFFDPSSMKSRRGETGHTMSPAQMFMQEGIYVVPANNERENGWRNVKAWMHHSSERGKNSSMYVCDCCEGLISTIPIQRYVPGKHDLDTRGKDDFVDAWRYLMSHIPFGSQMTLTGEVDSAQTGTNFEKERYPDKNKRKDELTTIYEGEEISIYASFE